MRLNFYDRLPKILKYYAEPQPVKNTDGSYWNGKTNLTVGNKTYYGEPRYVTSVNPRCRFRLKPSHDSPKVRWDIRGGVTLFVIGWEWGESKDGEKRWWVGPTGARIWCGHTVEKPKENL